MSGRILAGFLAMLLMILAGAAETTRVVQAEEILKKIELGQPVEYDNVTVVGDINLSGLDLPKVPVQRSWLETSMGLPDYEIPILSSINIANSVIEGSIDLNGTVFQNVALFNGTRFEGPVSIMGSRFIKVASFWRAHFNQASSIRMVQFNQPVSFQMAQFNGTTYFSGSKFNNIAEFLGAKFNHTAYFWGTRFSHASFEDTKFNGIAEFWGAKFNQSAFFWKARFNQTANFDGARFKKLANFCDAQFNKAADFRDAQFNQAAYFWMAKFSHVINLRKAQFNEAANFDGTQFNQESYFEDARFFDISFDNSQFSKEAFFQGARINGTFSLYRTKYDTLNIRWSSIHDLAYDDTAYHLLIQNFNKLGFGDDARECQYSYRCKHREELWRQHRFDRWLFDLLAWASYGYGLRPVRPLGWAALLILMGGLFFFLTGSVARSKESTEPAEKSLTAAGARENKPDSSVSIWESLLLSATYFTSGASSIISATPTEFVPVGRGRYVVVILRLMGWIFFVLFLSSLTRTV